MSDWVIEAEGLTKVYRSYARPGDRLREAVSGRRLHQRFTALEEVGFRLAPGESLGVIGENGAGKSTLLKILSGIVQPTTGDLEVRGKVAAILELGAGFHPDLTGRQNIVLNAAMLGLDEPEVNACLPGVIEFSELGRFIDQPVRSYSTGMAMRLGFAIATQVEPQILVIDEALSVGDGYFQKKCMTRLNELVAQGTTLLFCSHAMYYVSAFCQRALWLKDGRMAGYGPAAEVVRDYENFLLAKSDGAGGSEPAEVASSAELPPAEAASPARITEVRWSGSEDGSSILHASGEPLELVIAWESEDSAQGFHLGVGINRVDGLEVCAFTTAAAGLPPIRGKTAYEYRLRIPALPLVKGEFGFHVFLSGERALHIYDQRVVKKAFTVESGRYAFGLVNVEHQWLDERPVEKARPLRAVPS